MTKVIKLRKPKGTHAVETINQKLIEAVRSLVMELAMWPGEKNPESFPGMKMGRALLKQLTGDDGIRKPKGKE